MSEPSVEDIVLAYESAKAMGLPQNYLGHGHADALIADWRKRGEALEAAEPILAARSGWCGDDNDEVFPVLLKVRAALTPRQPPQAT